MTKNGKVKQSVTFIVLTTCKLQLQPTINSSTSNWNGFIGIIEKEGKVWSIIPILEITTKAGTRKITLHISFDKNQRICF
jgi:hypothetical protein